MFFVYMYCKVLYKEEGEQEQEEEEEERKKKNIALLL